MQPKTEIRPDAVFYRRLKCGRLVYRRVLHVHHDGSVVYTTPSRRGVCSARSFLRWAGTLRRFDPKAGPLL